MAPAATPSAALGGPREAAGQAPILNQDVAAARDKALEDAMRHLVDDMVLAIVGPEIRAAQAKALESIVSKPRRYLRGWRVLEQAEADGAARVRISGDINLTVLRRDLDRIAQAGKGTAQEPPPPSLLVVTSEPSPDERARLAEGLGQGGGARVVLGDPALADSARVLDVVKRAGHAAGVIVAPKVTFEGPLRGVGHVAARCSYDATVVRAAGPDEAMHIEERGFAEAEAEARLDCTRRLVEALAARVAPVIAASSGGKEMKVRSSRLLVTSAEPGLLFGLMKVLRNVASVSAVEPRLITSGRAEIAVTARLPPEGLLAALQRDIPATWTLTDAQVMADGIRMTLSSVAVVPPSAGAGKL